MTYIQNRLRVLREERDLKQQTVAEEVGLSRAMLSNYESGKMPSLWSGIKLAQYYGVSLDYIFGLSAERSATDGSLSTSFATLSRMTGDATPTATDVEALVNACILYKAAGSPCTDQPLIAWRTFMQQLTSALQAATSGDSARLMDAANAATVAALDIAKMPALAVKKKGDF